MPAAGGPVQVICDARGSTASWSESGDIIFSEWGPTTSDELQVVSENGGKPQVMTTGDGLAQLAVRDSEQPELSRHQYRR